MTRWALFLRSDNVIALSDLSYLNSGIERALCPAVRSDVNLQEAHQPLLH